MVYQMLGAISNYVVSTPVSAVIKGRLTLETKRMETNKRKQFKSAEIYT